MADSFSLSPVINITMRDSLIIVDEGVGQGQQSVCISVDLPARGMVECELTATVATLEGTASMYICSTHEMYGFRKILRVFK